MTGRVTRVRMHPETGNASGPLPPPQTRLRSVPMPVHQTCIQGAKPLRGPYALHPAFAAGIRGQCSLLHTRMQEILRCIHMMRIPLLPLKQQGSRHRTTAEAADALGREKGHKQSCPLAALRGSAQPTTLHVADSLRSLLQSLCTRLLHAPFLRLVENTASLRSSLRCGSRSLPSDAALQPPRVPPPCAWTAHVTAFRALLMADPNAARAMQQSRIGSDLGCCDRAVASVVRSQGRSRLFDATHSELPSYRLQYLQRSDRGRDDVSANGSDLASGEVWGGSASPGELVSAGDRDLLTHKQREQCAIA